MPGIPRTRRCERCRRRKIKCDENWPCCTSCLRANATCSGPSNSTPFRHYQHQNADQSLDAACNSSKTSSIRPGRSVLAVARQDQATLKPLKSQILTQGSSLNTFRLASHAPRPYPTSSSDRVASRLITHLEKSTPGVREFLLEYAYVEMLPARLGQCPALRDMVALLTSTWTNFQRGLPCSEVTDRRLYGKALRSLQTVLDSKNAIKWETLAAVCVLERYEIMFDSSRPLYYSTHRDGIASLLTMLGPPKIEDKFNVYLALGAHDILIAHWGVRGGHNFYLDEPWKRAIDEALQRYADPEDVRHYACRIEQYSNFIMPMMREMGEIYKARANWPSRSLDRDVFARAIQLEKSATALAAELDRVGEPALQKAFTQGSIREVPSPNTPLNAKYEFANMDLERFLVCYSQLRIVLNRIIWGLTMGFSGRATAILDMEHKHFARHIWMCLPYLRDASLMAASLTVDSFNVAYEAASGETKEYLLSWLQEVASFRKRLPDDREKLNQYLLDTARALTGREKYRERTDFPYWALREDLDHCPSGSN